MDFNINMNIVKTPDVATFMKKNRDGEKQVSPFEA